METKARPAATGAVGKIEQSPSANNDIDRRQQVPNKETHTGPGREIEEPIPLFKELNPSYKQMFGNTTERKALTRLLAEHGRDKLVALLQVLPEIVIRPYAPRITTPYELERKMGQLKIYMNQEKTKSKQTWTVI